MKWIKSIAMGTVGGGLVMISSVLAAQDVRGLSDDVLARVHGQTKGNHTITDSCTNYVQTPPAGAVSDCSGQAKDTPCYICPGSTFTGQAPGGSSSSQPANNQPVCRNFSLRTGKCPGGGGACAGVNLIGACTEGNVPQIYQSQPIPPGAHH